MESVSSVRRNPGRAKRGGVSLRWRLAVAFRVLAAAVGGYLVAALFSVCLAQWLPFTRAESVVLAMTVSFLAWLLVALWCFACRSVVLAWFGVLLPAGVFASLYGIGRWLS
ncbi:DUF3649 domain-containing protein [Pseudomonas huanghezhanensis]|uniref:DUF3649 domain-containing protein n=1 Tax=Pseudomonas huanghezhanensis TaxID=3002903 RepID=UPI002286C80F|nr:DUF3649 domain-containing protein [Pseudomonas sp. BSw22131]